MYWKIWPVCNKLVMWCAKPTVLPLANDGKETNFFLISFIIIIVIEEGLACLEEACFPIIKGPFFEFTYNCCAFASFCIWDTTFQQSHKMTYDPVFAVNNSIKLFFFHLLPRICQTVCGARHLTAHDYAHSYYLPTSLLPQGVYFYTFQAFSSDTLRSSVPLIWFTQ